MHHTLSPLRRKILCACAAASLLAMPLASAQTARYPEKSIKLVVGFPPGQATDLVARMLGEKLTTALGQAVLIENKPGQGGSLALAQVAKATPDGYTMTLAATAALLVNVHLYATVGYDTLKDFAPVASVVDLPLVLVANAAMPFNTFGEFQAYAKANPEKLRYGSSGNGTLSHLGMELLKRNTGLKMLHVPYKGSVPVMTDLSGGSIDVALDTYAGALPHLQSKRVKLIAVASEQRLSLAPDTPTIAESGVPGFSASPWLGLMFPKGTPADIVERVSVETQKALQDPALQQKLRTLGAMPRAAGSVALGQLLARENESWGRVVRESGAKID